MEEWTLSAEEACSDSRCICHARLLRLAMVLRDQRTLPADLRLFVHRDGKWERNATGVGRATAKAFT